MRLSHWCPTSPALSVAGSRLSIPPQGVCSQHQFLLQVYDRSKTTVFFITHDLEEAIFLGSKVYIMTTRPATIKKILDVDISRPRDFRVLSSPTYTRLKEECISAVHEEALKAFKAGEREM